LLSQVTGALARRPIREALLENAAQALLAYIEESTDGFRILVRDSPVTPSTGGFASLINDVASQVEHILVAEFKARGLEAKTAPLYSQMLVGMVALTGQSWLDTRKPKRDEVAAHLVNLAWNGLAGLEAKPTLMGNRPAKDPAWRAALAALQQLDPVADGVGDVEAAHHPGCRHSRSAGARPPRTGGRARRCR